MFAALVLSACSTSSPPSALVKHKPDLAAPNAVLVQSLQRQIKERDKHIAELNSRLDAMKVIDQDLEKRRRLSRPPATVIPGDSLIP
ncbi:MAG: hypothetical protein ABI980_10450 [Nitrospirota bacterium]